MHVTSPHVGRSVPGRVLFAATSGGTPRAEALRHAELLSRALGADLFALGVIGGGLVPPFDEVRRQRSLWDETLLEPLPPDRRLVWTGRFAVAVEEVAAALNVELVILAPADAGGGATALRVARRARVPVLVSRSPGACRAIVAATDLADARYPVVRRAADLGRRLDASLILVHNLRARRRARVSAGARMELLRSLADGVFPGAQVALGTHVDPADSILSEAEHHRADLIVVGTRRRTLPLPGRRTAARALLERASTNVLVTPIFPEGELS